MWALVDARRRGLRRSIWVLGITISSSVLDLADALETNFRLVWREFCETLRLERPSVLL
jgi:hypothetical protein